MFNSIIGKWRNKIDADHCKESIVNIDTIVKSGKALIPSIIKVWKTIKIVMSIS